MTEFRAELSSAQINSLPDSAFAYIESGGKKDADGKTAPRKLRHYPIQDKPHADDALSRANAQLKGDDDDAKTIAKAALPKIKAAVKKFADAEEQKAAVWDAQKRDSDPSYEDLRELLSSAVSAAYAKKEEEYTYVVDFSDDWVVFSKKGEKYECSYELDGSDVTLGKAVLVTTVTKYVPIQSNSERSEPSEEKCSTCEGTGKIKSGTTKCPTCKGTGKVAVESKSRNWATPKRAGFTSLVEQPPARTVDLQVRTDDEGHIAYFDGYPSPTGVSYSVRDWLGEYAETMDPGCYTKTLREQIDVPTLFNHDGVPMASTESGTKRLSENNKGLHEESEFDRRDALTNSIVVQMQRGVLGKMSISFRGIKDSWNDTYDDRHVGEAALYDTSIVTYPASPTAEGELVEEMRSALGREGRSLWLADQEMSIRSILPTLATGEQPPNMDDLLEHSLRALAHADEVVCRARGPHGRARTFLVAEAMLELRAGKTLSTKNQGLLKSALTALSSADKQHQKLADAHAKAADAVSSVLDGASASEQGTSQDGKNSNQGAGNGDPINPQDGAGPRSASLKLQRQREAELRALRR
jgi:HK97 family phage prohead protease